LFPGEAFAIWGWRFMFYCGLLTSGLGFFIFKYLEESPLWKQMAETRLVAGVN